MKRNIAANGYVFFGAYLPLRIFAFIERKGYTMNIKQAKEAAGNYVDDFLQGGKDLISGAGDFLSWATGGDPAGSKLPGTVSTPINTETNNNTTNNNNVNATITINNPADSGKAFQDKYGQLLLAPGLTGMTTK